MGKPTSTKISHLLVAYDLRIIVTSVLSCEKRYLVGAVFTVGQ
jgi:hypothetical protein